MSHRYVLHMLLGMAACILILFGLTCGCRQTPDTSELSAEPIIDSVASSDAVNIVYEVAGTGKPALVFVHGWCCNRSYWDAETDIFSDNYRVVAIDLAGHGESGMERETYSIEAFGDDVAAVVNKLELDSIILIGHSMGGSVIVEAAHKLPGKVLALVGVDCYNDLGTTYSNEEIQVFLEAFRTDFETATSGFVARMFPQNADSSIVDWVVSDMSTSPPEVGIGAFEALFPYLFFGQIQESMKSLNLPVYSINADMDPTNTEVIETLTPKHSLIVIPGVGHFIMLEDPESFNQALADVILDVTGKPVPEAESSE